MDPTNSSEAWIITDNSGVLRETPGTTPGLDYETNHECVSFETLRPTEVTAYIHTATREVSRDVKPSDSDREEKTRKIICVPGESNDEDFETALTENSREENTPTLGMLEDLMATSSLREDLSQSQALSNIGVSAYERFELTGDVEYIDDAIEHWVLAAALLPSSHPERSGLLSNIGDFRHEQGKFGEKAVSLTPIDHPYKPTCLSNLGNSYRTRFECLGELSGLNKAIEFQAQAVSLTPDGHPGRPAGIGNLGNSYTTRFERLGELSDLNKAIEYQAQSVLLTSDGDPNESTYLNNLGASYKIRFECLGQLSDMNKAIEYQAQSVLLTPGGHPDRLGRLSNLGASYGARFERLGGLLDLNKAIEYQTQAVPLAPDDHPYKPGCLSNLGNSYRTRFKRLGEPSDLNKAIASQAQAVSLTLDGHPDKPIYLNNVGISYMTRYERLGKLSDLNQAIESQAKAISLTPVGHPCKLACLSNLGISHKIRFERVDELLDLNKAIEYQVQAVSLAPDGHPYEPRCLSNLGTSYRARFERLCEPLDLNKAIECHAQAVSLTPDGHPDKSGRLGNLGNSYMTRFTHSGEFSDLQRAEASFKSASQSPTGPPSLRFYTCRQWAQLSVVDSTLSPFPAYQQAMSLIPQLVWIGNTIGRRYELVADVSGFATEAVSYAISTGAYNLALEWLEAGRSIVWGQISQLRSPFEDLSRRHPKLAEGLAAVGRSLEYAGSQSSFPSSPEASDPDLGQEASAHIQLALEWDSLLEEIRLMPGFKDFLRPSTADQLVRAAKASPIAIINLHQSRCDALILQPDCDTISHLSLTNFSSEDAVLVCHDVFCQVRERRPAPRLNPLRSVQSSLQSLWAGVIKPVLDFLGYTHKLPIDQLPDLTWCTTGLLSFLPLHTARSHDESHHSAFDLVISSYTPNIGALLLSQAAHPSSNCGILAIGQENTPGLTSLPCTTRELAVIHEHARSNLYLQLENDEATVEQVLDAMDQFSWVHIACHGSQDAHDPTQSAFHLHNGNLTLAAITERSFTKKGLAFLSACQTATGDKNMPDEAVHLAAGMLVAGYPSVIGTMWSIADEDGPEVAGLVYAELLKNGDMDYTESARALHQAVARLRAKVGEKDIARWAPFIHVGC